MERSDRLGMRVKPSDKAHWREIAAAEGLSLSAWVEAKLNEASKPVVEPQPLPEDYWETAG